MSSLAYWCAVQLKRNAFRQAEASLLRQELDVFCPKTCRTVRRYGKLVQEQAPLFPGYLFVSIDPSRPVWRSIASTPGVSRIITKRAGEPATVPPSLIEGLQSRCDAAGLLLPPDSFNAGDRVRIASGAFADLVATVERIDEQRRVWVLLDILGGSREVQVDPKELQSADAA